VPDLKSAPKILIKKLSTIGNRLSKVRSRSEHMDYIEKTIKEIDNLIFEFLGIKEMLNSVKLAEAKLMDERLRRKKSEE